MSLVIIAAKRAWSSPRTVLNCRPIPLPAFTYRTVALALISPSSTRKCNSTVEPTAHTLRVWIKRPPTLRSLTRDVSSVRPHRQKTATPSGVSTRLWCLREWRTGLFKVGSLDQAGSKSSDCKRVYITANRREIEFESQKRTSRAHYPNERLPRLIRSLENAASNASAGYKRLVIYGVGFMGFSTRSALKC
jgi:hypothetical protein